MAIQYRCRRPGVSGPAALALLVVSALGLAPPGLACSKPHDQDPAASPATAAANRAAAAAASTPGRSPAPAAVVPPGHLVSPSMVARVLTAGLPSQWFGLYVGKKKIGYGHLELAPVVTAAGEPPRVRLAMDTTMRSGGLGTHLESHLLLERLFDARPPYRLVELHTRDQSGDSTVEHRYRLDGDEMVVDETVDGTARPPHRIAASHETLLDDLDQQAVEPASVHPGLVVQDVDFDADKERDLGQRIRVADVRTRRLSGLDTQVVVLELREEGQEARVTVALAAGGVILSAGLGDNLAMRAEDKDQARSDVVGIDMIRDAVPIDRPLGDPSALHRLHLLVHVPAHFRLRDAPNQELVRRKGGALDVTLGSRPGLPVLATERGPALEATAAIDARDPAIADLSRTIVAGAHGPREKVSRLVHWVYRNLHKDLSTNLDTASQVLARRAGDCTEHALLFVALARAAGIPARELSGLIYMGDNLRRFGWHAWAEVDLDGRWVEVDPSWDEEVANATHLTLGVGDDTDWIATLGTLTIQVAPDQPAAPGPPAGPAHSPAPRVR